ncbi:MAG: tRNA (adenosine(37)-N6)-threonylcarbamoyltransferase complex transferase subunit TsaD [Patescibacteria group bacterium]
MPNNQDPLILAIDTSCDDTSAAVTQGWVVRSNVVASQAQLHKKYGGVFPTVAKLAHAQNITATVSAALQQARINPEQLSAVAVTIGPGLAPALEVGIRFAEQFAQQHTKPLTAINHLEGHLLSVLARPNSRTTAQAQPNLDTVFPALGLIISGGHSQFVLIKQLGTYQILGTTLDDAAGECLDKIGRMVNLGYPAGATIEILAQQGNPEAIEFPLPLTHRKDFDLSFSGLKTFARNTLATTSPKKLQDAQFIKDFCASAQAGVFRHLLYKFERALAAHPEIHSVWLGGGVAANMQLRKKLRSTIRQTNKKIPLLTPYSKKLCADNAAMIGVAMNANTQNTVYTSDQLQRQPRLKFG